MARTTRVATTSGNLLRGEHVRLAAKTHHLGLLKGRQVDVIVVLRGSEAYKTVVLVDCLVSVVSAVSHQTA